MSKHNKAPNYKRRRATGLTLVLGTAIVAGGSVVNDKSNESEVRNDQPACVNIVPDSGEGIKQILGRLNEAGGNTAGDFKIYKANGEERTRATDPELYRSSNNLITINETLGVEHVNPVACKQIGGVVLENLIGVDPN